MLPTLGWSSRNVADIIKGKGSSFQSADNNNKSREAGTAPRVPPFNHGFDNDIEEQTLPFLANITDLKRRSLEFLQIPHGRSFLILTQQQNQLVSFYKTGLTVFWTPTQRLRFHGLGWSRGTQCFQGCPGDSDARPCLRTTAPSAS